ncbi:MAG: phenylacetate--CoA ligase family protein [Deltaproteobacteria bacterium]|nr:MAG: phenylacetate--CoA ligase family protein [Deltaproteobacteria bacterium]
MGEKYYEAAVETAPRREIKRLQLERLKWQVQRCYEKSEFYRELYDRAGVKPSHLEKLSHISRFPVIKKEDLRREQALYPPFGRYPLTSLDRVRELHPSSGTTGNPVNTLWTESDVENITHFTARTLWGFGVRPGDIIQNAFSYGLWVAGMSVHYAARRLRCFVIPIGAGDTRRQLYFLKTVKPTVILATPSFGIYLSEKIEGEFEGEETSLRIGAFGGEAGTEVPSTREKLERRLGIDAFDYYGLAEMSPTFAAECEAKDGLHWAEDHFLVEVVNPDTMEPCAEGEVGVLVLTHLTKEGTPLIRYWTNDYAKVVTSRCACGRTLARSPGGILGSADDLLIYKGAKFYPVQVEKVVRSFPELSDEYRIRFVTDEERSLETCTVIVEKSNKGVNLPDSTIEGKLKKALREELLVTPEVEILPPDTLERTAFKAKRVERVTGGGKSGKEVQG